MGALAGDFFQILVLMELSSNDENRRIERVTGDDQGLNQTESFGISAAILASIGLLSFFIVRDIKIKPDESRLSSSSEEEIAGNVGFCD